MVTLVPPLSKSDAQRALVLGDVRGLPVALGDGALPRDVEVLRAGLAALREPSSFLECHDGGAPFRFLLTQAALLPGRVARLSGTGRLAERPHGPLLDALRATLGPQGLELTQGKPWPLVVRAPPRLVPPLSFRVSGAESSQYASSLLLGAARAAQGLGEPVEVALDGPLTSGGYLGLTLRWLAAAGFGVESAGGSFLVTRGAPPTALPPVPGDWSSLGYLLLLAWRSGAAVARVAFDSGHPDEAIARHLRGAGLSLATSADAGAGLVTVSGEARGGLEVDAAECPDAVPTLAALATALPEPSRFRNVAVLQHKESDRRAGVVDLVCAAGSSASLKGEELVVTPGAPRPFDFDAREDHRLAMSAAVLAFLHGVRARVRGKDAVGKSFPAFWAEAGKVGCAVEAWR